MSTRGLERAWQSRWIGVAAALLIVAVTACSRGPGERASTEAPRGSADSSSNAVGEVVLEMPRALPNGDFELRWKPTHGAKHYRIDIISVELQPLERGTPQTDTVGMVRRAALPKSLTSGANFYARVVALDEDRRIAESALVSLLAR